MQAIQSAILSASAVVSFIFQQVPKTEGVSSTSLWESVDFENSIEAYIHRFLTLTQIKTQKVDPSPELYQSIGSVFILLYFTKHDLQDGKCDGIMLAYQGYAWNIYEYYIETPFVCSTV